MRWEWLIHVITVPILAQFPSNKYIDDVTRGLIVNITTPVDGQIKIDNMFQEKADQAVRAEAAKQAVEKSRAEHVEDRLPLRM